MITDKSDDVLTRLQMIGIGTTYSSHMNVFQYLQYTVVRGSHTQIWWIPCIQYVPCEPEVINLIHSWVIQGAQARSSVALQDSFNITQSTVSY